MDREPIDVAIEIARKSGRKFEDSDVDRNKSDFYYGKDYILMHKNGSKIACIDQKVVRFKCKGIDSSVGSNIYSDQARAIAWARSMGYPIPIKMNGCLSTFLIVIGLTAFIVPGLLLIFFVIWKDNQYRTEVVALVTKWVEAGKPEPGIKENLDAKQAAPLTPPPLTPQAGIEGKLAELQSMKDKGVITEDEYQLMRKKALGL